VHLTRVALTLLILSVAPPSLGAQQREDLYTVPAKSRYQPGRLQGKRPLTRAERTNFQETSLYADVVQFIDSLVVLGAKIEKGSIGKTAEGRDLPYVIASRPLITTPEEARRQGRPVAYIQANIHSGEVEGKEAMLAMLRDLLFDPRPNVLDSIVLIVQPDYNADGNEKLADNQRGSQNGPRLAGTRSQAQAINLNRDYIGADAPETRASLAMLNRWKPDLFMDLHTTDGSIHGYALTYAPTLSPTAVTVAPFLFDRMMPEIRRRVRERQGYEMNDYGDFSRARGAGAGPAAAGSAGAGRAAGAGAGAPAAGRAAGAPAAAGTAAPGRAAAPAGGGAAQRGIEEMIADSIPTAGWTFSTYSHLPRYGANYWGLKGRLSILSEAFSHDPFDRRVASTYAFVGEILSYVAEHRQEILALGTDSDARVAQWAARPGSSPALALQSRMDTTRIEEVRVEVVQPLADTTRREAGMGNRQRTGIVKLVRMPVMASFEPTLTSTLPFAYAFQASAADSLLPILKIHGIEVEQVTAAANVTAQGFVVQTIVNRPRNETPRDLRELQGTWGQPAPRSLPAGSYVVRAGQPGGLLAFYLMEAQSDDGLQPFLNAQMREGQEYPILRITAAGSIPSRRVP
jgi:hypothetical protein